MVKNRQPGMDAHHVLWDRASWTLRKESLYLRDQEMLIPMIDREAHNELHRNCPPVPALGYYALRRTMKLWEPDRSPLRSMANLTEAIGASTRVPQAHRLEKELASLTIQAIDLQAPYIREGLSSEKVFIDLGA